MSEECEFIRLVRAAVQFGATVDALRASLEIPRIPATVDEVRQAENDPEIQAIELPESLRDPEKVWEMIRARSNL